MPPRKRKGQKPQDLGEKVPKREIVTESEGYPHLCLRHTQPGWGIEDLESAAQAQFILKWAQRSRFTWAELRTHQRHGLGSEKIPRWKIKPSIPEKFKADDYIVYRHHGNLPFAGLIIKDVFYVLWIEKSYNDLYDHS